jgi:hypothetical protein
MPYLLLTLAALFWGGIMLSGTCWCRAWIRS